MGRVPLWTGHLNLAAGEVIYTGPGGTAESHCHLAVQVVRALDRPFQIRLEGERLSTENVLIPSMAEHSFDATGTTLVLALIEPTGELGSRLDAIARAEGPTQPLAELPALGSEPPASLEEILGGTLQRRTGDLDLGTHVQAAIEYVDSHIEGKLRLPAVADAIGISPTRLTHLFTAQVGIPFGRYVLWARLRRVVEELGTGTGLARAAVDAGFSDSSHLSRVFKQNFGLSPSALMEMDLESDWLPEQHG